MGFEDGWTKTSVRNRRFGQRAISAGAGYTQDYAQRELTHINL
jgi:hypothetical protein